MLYLFFFFFFSSRRRHTRYIGDWSSDVCSSDLYTGGPPNSLFDDSMIDAWNQGWNMIYGLNPISFTFESSHGWLNDGYWTEYTTITLNDQHPNELIHCDPQVQKAITQMRQEARRTSQETGFSVERKDGKLVPGKLKYGPSGTEVILDINKATVATFHMHLEMSVYPSPHDRDNA